MRRWCFCCCCCCDHRYPAQLPAVSVSLSVAGTDVFTDTVVLVDSTLEEVIALVKGREQASAQHAELDEGAFLSTTRAAPGLLLTPPDIPALPFPGGTGTLTEDATLAALIPGSVRAAVRLHEARARPAALRLHERRVPADPAVPGKGMVAEIADIDRQLATLLNARGSRTSTAGSLSDELCLTARAGTGSGASRCDWPPLPPFPVPAGQAIFLGQSPQEYIAEAVPTETELCGEFLWQPGPPGHRRGR